MQNGNKVIHLYNNNNKQQLFTTFKLYNMKSLQNLKTAFQNLENIAECLTIGWVNDIYANTLNYKYLPTPEKEARQKELILKNQAPYIIIQMAENPNKYKNYSTEGSASNWKKAIKKVYNKYFA